MRRQHLSIPNHEHVLAVLRKAERPLSAYGILDAVRRVGINAPTPVYRALERLIDSKLVHRLETLSAYVVRRNEKQTHPFFAICDDCGSIEEFGEENVFNDLADPAKRDGFTVRVSTVELRGRCGKCIEESNRRIAANAV